MTREDIVRTVSKRMLVSQNVINRVIDIVLEETTNALANGEKVQFAGFGTFKPKRRAARTGRNPHTGEAVPIPARIIPCFEPGKNLMASVCRNIKGIPNEKS